MIESKPLLVIDVDLRMAELFKGLVDFSNKFAMMDMETDVHSHIPFPIIIC